MIDRYRRVEVLSSPRLPSAAALSKIIPSSIVEGNIEKIITARHTYYSSPGATFWLGPREKSHATNFLSILAISKAT